ncbi:MAG: hypothetical protein E3K36_08595 [Candidatus Brocadia sp.]|nr:hypothetical protein [Candidatus Brocadia sp.]
MENHELMVNSHKTPAGNLLILLGVGIVGNSLLFLLFGFPFLLFAYLSIICAGGKRLEDRKNRFLADMILMASPLFLFISRLCITDMLLTFFVCASLYLFFIEYAETNKNNLRKLFLYFLLSMVFLVKGPICILLFILITMGFLLWIRDFQHIRCLWYLPGFPIFLGIICAWGIPFWLSLTSPCITFARNDLYPSHFPFHCITDQVTFPMGYGRHFREKVLMDIVACIVRVCNDSPGVNFCHAKMGTNRAWFIHNSVGRSHYGSFHRDCDIALYFLHEQAFSPSHKGLLSQKLLRSGYCHGLFSEILRNLSVHKGICGKLSFRQEELYAFQLRANYAKSCLLQWEKMCWK